MPSTGRERSPRWRARIRSLTQSAVRRAGGRTPAPAAPADIKFLQGPRPRGLELGSAVRIFREIVYGFRKLHFVGPCVTVFGSARFDEHHRYYAMAREVGRLLAESGFTVMTGGGPGIMEAANRGAKDVRRPVARVQHRAAAGAEAEPLPRFVDRLRVLLRPQDDAGEVQLRLRRLPRRVRHAGRTVRGRDADPDRQGAGLPGRADGHDYWRRCSTSCGCMVAEKTIDPIDLDRLIVSDDPGEVVSGDHRHRDEAVRPDLRPEGEAAVVAAGDVRAVVEPAAPVSRIPKARCDEVPGLSLIGTSCCSILRGLVVHVGVVPRVAAAAGCRNGHAANRATPHCPVPQPAAAVGPQRRAALPSRCRTATPPPLGCSGRTG